MSLHTSVQQSNFTNKLILSFFSTSLRFWHCTSLVCASRIFWVEGNSPTSSLVGVKTVSSSPIYLTIEYAGVSSLTSVIWFSFSDVICGSLEFAFAASWYFPGRLTILKSNFINLNPHQAKFLAGSLKSNFHCWAWWSIHTIKCEPFKYGLGIRAAFISLLSTLRALYLNVNMLHKAILTSSDNRLQNFVFLILQKDAPRSGVAGVCFNCVSPICL